MVAEFLAVVGADDHGGAGPMLAEHAHQLLDGVVHGRHLPVVPLLGALPAGEAWVGLVGLVRLEQVHPREHLALRALLGVDGLEVLAQLRDAGVGRREHLLLVLEAEAPCAQRLEAVRVHEEDGGRIERGRAHAVAPQQLGQGHVLGGGVGQLQHRAQVLAREHAGERVAGVRRGRVGVAEHGRLRGQPVQVGGQPAATADAVCAQGIHRDQQHVARLEPQAAAGLDAALGGWLRVAVGRAHRRCPPAGPRAERAARAAAACR